MQVVKGAVKGLTSIKKAIYYCETYSLINYKFILNFKL